MTRILQIPSLAEEVRLATLRTREAQASQQLSTWITDITDGKIYRDFLKLPADCEYSFPFLISHDACEVVRYPAASVTTLWASCGHLPKYVRHKFPCMAMFALLPRNAKNVEVLVSFPVMHVS